MEDRTVVGAGGPLAELLPLSQSDWNDRSRCAARIPRPSFFVVSKPCRRSATALSRAPPPVAHPSSYDARSPAAACTCPACLPLAHPPHLPLPLPLPCPAHHLLSPLCHFPTRLRFYFYARRTHHGTVPSCRIPGCIQRILSPAKFVIVSPLPCPPLYEGYSRRKTLRGYRSGH